MIVSTADEAAALVKDPTARAVIRAARAWGLRPSDLLRGGVPTSSFRIERDATGQAVRLVAPPWSLEDRLLAVALEVYDAETCTGCGQHLADSTDPANENAYEIGAPTRCHACTMLAMTADSLPESTRHRDALRFGVHLNEGRRRRV